MYIQYPDEEIKKYIKMVQARKGGIQQDQTQSSIDGYKLLRLQKSEKRKAERHEMRAARKRRKRIVKDKKQITRNKWGIHH